MNGEGKFEMQCAEFDALLAEALDGTLSPSQMASFERHKENCATCSVMFAEAQAGMNWLQSLEEVEPPRNLVHNILVATTGQESAARVVTAQKQPWWERAKVWVQPHVSPLFTPRFAMAAATAFFSITLAMTVAGIRVQDLTPSGLTRTYYQSQARVVKYYENIRLVYEIESRVRELKRVTSTDTDSNEQNQQKKQPPKDEKQNNTNREPEHKQQDQNYSREKNSVVLDALAIRLNDPERQREEV